MTECHVMTQCRHSLLQLPLSYWFKGNSYHSGHVSADLIITDELLVGDSEQWSFCSFCGHKSKQYVAKTST